jgi:hypothetical protein
VELNASVGGIIGQGACQVEVPTRIPGVTEVCCQPTSDRPATNLRMAKQRLFGRVCPAALLGRIDVIREHIATENVAFITCNAA